jgi:ribosomal protein L16 Arg81 hydroxylase
LNFEDLKIRNQLGLIKGDDLPWAHYLAPFKTRELIETYLRTANEGKLGKSVRFHSYKDGQVTYSLAEELRKFFNPQELSALEHSFRITNIQTFHPQLKDFCKSVFSNERVLLACSVYLTPNRHSQAFLYHSDPQHILVYQVQGRKTWSFPKINGSYITDHTLRQDNNKLLNESKVVFDEEKIEICEGQFMYIPYAISHKAVNETDTPSVHLTFSENAVYAGNLYTFMAQQFLGLKDAEKMFYDEVAKEVSYQNPGPQETEEKFKSFYSSLLYSKYKSGGV